MDTEESFQPAGLSENDLEPVLELFRGRDPEVVARETGVAKDRLLRIRDDLLAQAESERSGAIDGMPKKIGRNAPCPCGSGKKYKHCCLNRPGTVRSDAAAADTQQHRASQAEATRLITKIEGAFALLGKGHYAEAMRRASHLLERYPDEDRLHDIVATSHLYAGQSTAAIAVCRRRLAVAESEKAYFIEHGRYRDADINRPALSYIYPPLTWLQKSWIAAKAADYQALYPTPPDSAISSLVSALQDADDTTRFPATSNQGLAMRRAALKDTLNNLAAVGPAAIPYLRPLTVRYSWGGLLATEILGAGLTDSATRALIDISMFGFAYASGASLHFLEKQGESVIDPIRQAFARDEKFDPIKTGIVAVLGNLRTPAAYSLLMELLGHESAHIVNWAGDALGKFNRVDALPALIAASDRIGGETMIEAAILKLKDLDVDHPESLTAARSLRPENCGDIRI